MDMEKRIMDVTALANKNREKINHLEQKDKVRSEAINILEVEMKSNMMVVHKIKGDIDSFKASMLKVEDSLIRGLKTIEDTRKAVREDNT